MAMSHEQKMVLSELIKPRISELTFKLNETYKEGSVHERDTIIHELSVLQTICKRFNIQI